LDDHLSPSHRFDAPNVPRKVADDLHAFCTYNKLDNRHIVEFAQEIAIHGDLAIANQVFAAAIRKSDSDDATALRQGDTVA
jgi:hypothetical protein